MIKAAVARTPILAFILMFFALGYTVAHNQVVVVPLGADAGVSGHEIVSNSLLVNMATTSTSFVQVECPPGKKVIGGGGMTGTTRHVLRSSRPLSESEWRIGVTRKAGTVGGAASATAYAICANTIN